MAVGLYVVTSTRVPSLGEGIELLMVQAADDPEPADDLEVASEAYSCVTTLVATSADLEDLLNAVSSWWLERAGVEPILELLTADVSAMSSDQRESLAELGPESWSVRTPLVVFRRESASGAADARAFIMKTALSIN